MASFAAATALMLLLWSSMLPARAGGLTQPDGGPVGQTAADGTATDANAEPNTQPEPDTQPAPEADASVDGGSAPDAPAAPDSSTGTADHADDDRAPTADGDQRTGDRGGTQAHNPDTGRRGADRSANTGAPPATPAPQHSTRSNGDSATGYRGTGATDDDAGAGSGDAPGPESRASTADDE
ncbi:MAG: hypothetical protein KY460_17855 [Actinobacteria bacterium]|nr:hypothetical protein [Actinomycetota bacterium]